MQSRATKIAKRLFFELIDLESTKLISRKNLSDRKFLKFPHCVFPVFHKKCRTYL